MPALGHGRAPVMHVLILPTLLLVQCWASSARARQASSRCLHLRVDGGELSGRRDIALGHLDYARGLDRDHNLQLTWAWCSISRASPTTRCSGWLRRLLPCAAHSGTVG